MDDVGDDDDAEAQGWSEGRGACAEQAFSYTEAAAGVVHTGHHLLIFNHATLETGSSEMVAVETTDLREQMPELALLEQASTDLAIASIGAMLEIKFNDHATLESPEMVAVDPTDLREQMPKLVLLEQASNVHWHRVCCC